LDFQYVTISFPVSYSLRSVGRHGHLYGRVYSRKLSNL
jgi:hypothetical protein